MATYREAVNRCLIHCGQVPIASDSDFNDDSKLSKEQVQAKYFFDTINRELSRGNRSRGNLREFTITTSGASNAYALANTSTFETLKKGSWRITTPGFGRNLGYKSYDTWTTQHPEGEAVKGTPIYWIDLPEDGSGQKVAFSPPPDGAYTVKYLAYREVAPLVAATDLVPWTDRVLDIAWKYCQRWIEVALAEGKAADYQVILDDLYFELRQQNNALIDKPNKQTLGLVMNTFPRRWKRGILSWLMMLLLTTLSALAQSNDSPTTPAQMTELSQLGRSLKTEVVTPSKGVMTSISDILRDSEYAKVLNNLQMLQRGIWTNVGIGWTKQRETVFNSGARFLEFATHTTSNGTRRVVFQTGDKVYSYDLSTSTETQIASGWDATAIPCIRSFSNTMLLYCNGKMNPYRWDGDPANAMQALANWPPTVGGISYSNPKYLEVFASRACFAGFPDRPHTVLFSVQNDPTAYTISSPALATDGGAFELPSQLGKITGLKAIRLSNDNNDQVLIIGCERGMAIITGFSGPTFSLKELTREYGLLSNRTFLQLQNDLLFLGTDGLRSFSQLVTNVNLLNSTLSFGIQDLMNRINKAKGEEAFAVRHPETQEIQFWMPVDSETTNGHAIILNYNNSSEDKPVFETLSPIFSTKSGTTVACAIDIDGTMYGGGYDGYLQKHYSGDTYDGVEIEWQYVPALFGANSPAQSASSRRFLILTDGGPQQFTAEAYTVNTMADGRTAWTIRDSRQISAPAVSINKMGTWVSPSDTTTTYPKFIDFSSRGNGRYWALRLKGTTSNDKIALVGVMSVLTVGGWKQ